MQLVSAGGDRTTLSDKDSVLAKVIVVPFQRVAAVVALGVAAARRALGVRGIIAPVAAGSTEPFVALMGRKLHAEAKRAIVILALGTQRLAVKDQPGAVVAVVKVDVDVAVVTEDRAVLACVSVQVFLCDGVRELAAESVSVDVQQILALVGSGELPPSPHEMLVAFVAQHRPFLVFMPNDQHLLRRNLVVGHRLVVGTPRRLV